MINTQKPYWWDFLPSCEIINREYDFHSQKFTTTSIHLEEVYEKEKQKINEHWKMKSNIAGSSQDRDLEDLLLKHENEKQKFLRSYEKVNHYFNVITSHFSDMQNDCYKNELSANKFNEFLGQMNEVIIRNKELGLNSWKKPIVEIILKKIAENNLANVS